jgi:hypothetical protein
MEELREAIQSDDNTLNEESVKTLAAISSATSADPLVSSSSASVPEAAYE